MIEVLEVDQWTSTGNIKEQSWDDLKAKGIDAVSGGDSEAARVIFGGDFRFKEVDERSSPGIARVWFIKGADGRPELYKYRYDSSD